MSQDNSVQVIQDKDKNYLIFNLSKEGVLQVINSSSGSTTNISSSLTDKVTAFTIFSETTPAEKVRIAVATAKDEKPQVYLTDSLELKGLNWGELSKKSDLWESCPLDVSDATGAINQMALNSQTLAAAIVTKDKDASYYCTEIGKEKLSWQKYSLPENSPAISQILLGTVYQNQGVFLLYQVGNEQTLLFQSFIDPKYGKTSKYRFLSEEPVISIATFYGADGNSSLYAMSQKQVLLFTQPEEKIEILVSQDDYLLEQFTASKIVKDLNSVTALEHQDKEYSKDKSDHYVLSYSSGLLPGGSLNLFIK
jgi:hypothetical protein